MQRKIEQLAGQARKLSSSQHPLHFLLYSSNKHLQEDSKYVDLQVGKQVWFNVPRRMRQELWLSVLHKHRGAGATAAKQYVTLVRQVMIHTAQSALLVHAADLTDTASGLCKQRMADAVYFAMNCRPCLWM